MFVGDHILLADFVQRFLDVCDRHGGLRSLCGLWRGYYWYAQWLPSWCRYGFLSIMRMFLVEFVFTVVESFVNVCTLSINTLNDMLTDCVVNCEFVSVQCNKTRPCAEIVIVFFLLDVQRNDFIFHGIEGLIEDTMGVLV